MHLYQTKEPAADSFLGFDWSGNGTVNAARPKAMSWLQRNGEIDPLKPSDIKSSLLTCLDLDPNEAKNRHLCSK